MARGEERRQRGDKVRHGSNSDEGKEKHLLSTS